jgi:hypothetical protein
MSETERKEKQKVKRQRERYNKQTDRQTNKQTYHQFLCKSEVDEFDVEGEKIIKQTEREQIERKKERDKETDRQTDRLTISFFANPKSTSLT